jgi:hypothetical protein
MNAASRRYLFVGIALGLFWGGLVNWPATVQLFDDAAKAHAYARMKG